MLFLYHSLDAEGLQLDLRRGTLELIPAGSIEGLEVSHGQESSTRVKAPPTVDVSVTSPIAIATELERRRPRWHIPAAISTAVLFVVAIVVGSVVGTKAARSSQATSNANQTTGSVSVASGREKSSSGVWNGTGIATQFSASANDGIDSAVNGSYYFLFYQDFTGVLKYATFNVTGDHVSLFSAGNTVNVEAGNGTALACTSWGSDPMKMTLQLIYIDPENTLSDVYLTGYNLSGSWVQGNLSTYGFKAPLDNRPAMNIGYSQDWYGMSEGTGGSRLWAGGMDGILYQYSYDWQSQVWSPQSYDFPDSYGYGGIFPLGGPSSDGTFNTTIYTSGEDGTLEYRIQRGNNETNWPGGGLWTEPVRSQLKAATNTSFIANWQTTSGDYTYYVNESGNLSAQLLNLEAADTAFDNTKSVTLDVTVMLGSDMSLESPNGKTILFYQPNGTHIGWKSLWGIDDGDTGLFEL